MLYTLLTGVPPQYQARASGELLTALDILSGIVSGAEVRNPRELEEKVPAFIAAACLKALAKSPSQRYATAAEISAALRAIKVDLDQTHYLL